MPLLGIQVAVTHMYRGDKLKGLEDFFLQHVDSVEPREPAEALKLAKPFVAQLKAAEKTVEKTLHPMHVKEKANKTK